jgi:hypothetical protein
MKEPKIEGESRHVITDVAASRFTLDRITANVALAPQANRIAGARRSRQSDQVDDGGRRVKPRPVLRHGPQGNAVARGGWPDVRTHSHAGRAARTGTP